MLNVESHSDCIPQSMCNIPQRLSSTPLTLLVLKCPAAWFPPLPFHARNQCARRRYAVDLKDTMECLLSSTPLISLVLCRSAAWLAALTHAAFDKVAPEVLCFLSEGPPGQRGVNEAVACNLTSDQNDPLPQAPHLKIIQCSRPTTVLFCVYSRIVQNLVFCLIGKMLVITHAMCRDSRQ